MHCPSPCPPGAGHAGVYTACLVLVGLVNSIPEDWIAGWTSAGAWAHYIGAALMTVLVPLVATSHQDASWVFTSFDPAPAAEVGIESYG